MSRPSDIAELREFIYGEASYMYRDIWASDSSESPQVGDYVEGPYGERGVILSRESNPDSFWVGLFGETGNNSVREVPSAAFPGRWEVRR